MIRILIPFALVLVAMAALPPGARSADTSDGGRPNILMLAVDDLRPELACYGAGHIHSPNIDALSASGLRFDRAYCNIPVCGASRASLFTGVRPHRTRFTTHYSRADQDAPKCVPLHTLLKSNGYHTVSLGKVLHVVEDSAAGWSEPVWRPSPKGLVGGHYRLPESFPKGRLSRDGRGLPYEAADVPDNAYGDGRLADEAVTRLRTLARQDQPFFLAVGFFKPHLPFVAPQKYWDLYDAEAIKLPDNYGPPKGAPSASLHNFGELRAYADVPRTGPVSDELALKLIRGYYACVSYTDAQIGRVLAELKRLKLDENTMVLLWGDHGWNLGEHGLWCKHCCYETSMRVPLILRVPGFKSGQSTPALVEYTDLYPTLCELTGVALPQQERAGQSLVPLLKDPQTQWKDYAVGRYGAGDTICSDRYRFSVYTRPNGDPVGRMLYDHQEDPRETVNIVERNALSGTVGQMRDALWKAYPAAGKKR